MDIGTSSFCSSGGFLGGGRILNVGGNQANTTSDDATWNSQPASYGGEPYEDDDSGNTETLADGSMLIIGGDTMGGYVNDAIMTDLSLAPCRTHFCIQNRSLTPRPPLRIHPKISHLHTGRFPNNPMYEFFPSTGGPYDSQLLADTLPANLHPLTWLMPSGNLFIQANWATKLLNLVTGKETPLPNVPHAVRTYPASAATVMLPLTVANNYSATILMCGGSNINDWNPNDNVIIDIAASKSCVRITPDGDQICHDDTSLPEGRTMGSFIILPDATLFLLNGGGMGMAGYDTQDWAIDESYATDPITAPLIYYPTNRTFTRAGLANSTINRLYHSSALLLADDAVFVAGSNPHTDLGWDEHK
ncbi:hypothetical protein DL93DRAFT_2102923 [Clavulina sp. PMI_390]|nr:hypothetical protein DL93DRAFT_2102923 [Clavulina sp. PMI_390]